MTNLASVNTNWITEWVIWIILNGRGLTIQARGPWGWTDWSHDWYFYLKNYVKCTFHFRCSKMVHSKCTHSRALLSTTGSPSKSYHHGPLCLVKQGLALGTQWYFYIFKLIFSCYVLFTKNTNAKLNYCCCSHFERLLPGYYIHLDDKHDLLIEAPLTLLSNIFTICFHSCFMA